MSFGCFVSELHISDYPGNPVLSSEASFTQRSQATKSAHRQQGCDQTG